MRAGVKAAAGTGARLPTQPSNTADEKTGRSRVSVANLAAGTRFNHDLVASCNTSDAYRFISQMPTLRSCTDEGDQRDPHGRCGCASGGRGGAKVLPCRLACRLATGPRPAASGTFSAVNADSFDADGHLLDQIYSGSTRRARHDELIDFAIKGGIHQARQAHELSGGQGRINANILWEMGGAERVITGVLEGAKGLIHGLTCGAGMPYRLSDIAAKFGVHYYPIVSSSGPSMRSGSAPTARRRRCSAVWSTRIRGWPAGTTACPTARIRSGRRIRIRACSRCAS